MNLDYAKTALIEIDVQNDFCPAYTDKNGRERPAGALAVNRACEIIELLNGMAAQMRRRGGKVLATQDWHPAGHVSFASSHEGKKPGDMITIPVQQTLWPDHCVENTEGAAFHDGLDTSLFDCVFRKGTRKHIDSYSAFFENDRSTPTELYPYLKKEGIDTVFVGGLATDYCVFYSVIDSLQLGLVTYFVEDISRGIDIPPCSLKQAEQTMKEKGAIFIASTDL